MLDFIRTQTLSFILLIVNFILFILVIVNNLRIKKIKENSVEFMRKLGTGKNITEDIEKYMDRIIELESGLSETNIHCKQLDKKIETCVQKVGIVRYSAYKDAGNDLSFAVALLDEKNNGVVFNGLYSKEMSSTYAKPIEDGKSKYTMTPEEGQAVLRAMGDE